MLELYLRSYVEDLRGSLDEIDIGVLSQIVQTLLVARREGRQVLIIGNGGSAATASHMACDLGKGTTNYRDPRYTRFRALSLSDNNALMSAVGNDLSFEQVFAEQLRIVMNDGDVVVVISASGNSPNLLRAVEYARSRRAVTVGLLGFGGGKLRGMVDHALVVSSRNYGVSEDFHAIAMHVLTQYLRRLTGSDGCRVAFVDRDGIINQRAAAHQYIESWAQFRFLDGAREMLRELATRGYQLVVVTNQQGVGKGRVSSETLAEIHDRMTAALAVEGIPLAGIYCCPHLESDRCFCRKPKPGLIFRALNELSFSVDVPGSVLIGDSVSDVMAGNAAGIKTLLVGGSREPGADLATLRAASVADVVETLDRCEVAH